MHREPNLVDIQKEYHGSIHSYVIGFMASFFLTFLSFGLVLTRVITGKFLLYSLVALALFQAFFQLRYFLKLGYEAHPRWETVTFYFMVLVLLIIAIGSLWIMHDLDSRLMMDMSNMDM